MLRLSQLPLGLALTILAAVNVSAVPSVNVGMKAAFPAGPYLLELLETAAGENASSYFPLLDRVADGYFKQATTDKALYERFLEVLQEDGHITNTEALSTFKLSLSTRSSAPRIEAHYQYYETAAESQGAKKDCELWVHLGGQQFCSPTLQDGHNTKANAVKDLPFDRALGAGAEAVLYADPASSDFRAFHKALSEKAAKGEVTYKLRYRRPSGGVAEPLPISGYGVELALKRTDYIVIDDREAQAQDSQKPIAAEVDLDEEEEVKDLKPLSTSELSSLGLKAASFIMQSQNPLDALVKLTQDLPKFSASIAAHDVSEDFEKEHKLNREHMVPSGTNVLWMNGIQLIERQIQPYTLLDMLRKERRLIDGVRELGLTGKQAVSLLAHEKVSAKSDDEPMRFDWRDSREDGRVIMWLNDLENDEGYAHYPTELTALLQRGYPGQMPGIRRNIFHLVVPVDMTLPADISVVANLYQFVKRALPIRFGLVPITPTAEKAKQAKVVYHLFENYGVEAATTYLQTSLSEKLTDEPDQELFDQVVAASELLPDSAAATLSEVLGSEEKESQVKLSQKWVTRLNAATEIPTVFVNGLPTPRDRNWMQTMSMQVSRDLQSVQQGVYMGLITEDDWIPGRFLEGAALRRSEYIYPDSDKSLKILNVNKVYSEHHDLLSQVPFVQAYVDATKETWGALTVVVDLTTTVGKDILLSALTFQRDSPGVRLDVVHNPEAASSAGTINRALSKVDLTEIQDVAALQKILDSADGASDDVFAASLTSFLTATTIAAGSNVLILNGRVIGPITDLFDDEDFHQFFEFEQSSRILPVYDALTELGLGDKLSGPLAAAKLTSITALSMISDLPEGIFESAPTSRLGAFDDLEHTHTAIEVGDVATASIQLVGMLNPVSEQGQRWAPIIKVLSELDGVYLKLFLNPREKIEELPVKRFFRYVLESAPSFDENGKVRAVGASFKGLPSEALLTAGMNIPPAWLVAPKISPHDLDNIKLSSVKGDVEATYELEHILIEGHSREEPAGSPPRGAQVVLATETEPLLADTIIMSNLGYFQFKANPGYYNIRLKEGRTTEIYELKSVGAKGYSAVAGDEGTETVLMDFQGTTLYPRLHRKPGQETADVLGEPEEKEEDGLLSQGIKFAGGLFGGGSTKSVSDEEHAEINVFSVASGHLYERMLNIMMASVMKNTKHTVKFWFLEQFLSPSFKDFIPHMAAEYGFKYEMVAFKWPHWLRAQKEKQREIWGYKILFLDVLFPLSLDKVIFVDADQIVRTDLMDLVQHDLEGKPYGFTPMCDSRTEMEGFRFWKQGYWRNYLKGLPYHISALYVVDLGRFRELAAGDRLRQTYHALSQDPNSLANLDQDLPNHMQFSIPIHSLPQEWLWCETWCSDESQAEARTIDLCNNPQTKEPKLDRARRQVPEWTVYDDEIAALDRRRRGLPADGKQEAAVQEEEQKSVAAEEAEKKNPKSRNWEEKPSAEATHKKDEL
ncbi:UDP-glucose:glycoprotein glucosyltransferase [Plectosphaerella cucumerina]|uniref:UDP-glucose:glycoprotein glucosyltransferase n=1 Tax=Plectosphaerella cucumerina TaxID=40658 RepID=A0A8K0TSG2_9PEZI|nr:UDP-glucose:glycoprotein glucosyltransferase [Plectosphaerella cucumerina]